MNHPRFSDRVCAVCARPAIGYGYAPKFTKVVDIAWCCDDPECLAIARDSYTMKQTEFTRLDSLATEEGGALGGAFLDRIGKTDLATMTQDEWQEFCRQIIAGYRTALKEKLRYEAPF